jgi:competence protein ComEC
VLKPNPTRFRAYQLGSAGSSFSYFADGRLHVIEGRLTATSKVTLMREMATCQVPSAYSLEITSWDRDHCSAPELPELLDLIRPTRIEMPGYEPGSDNGWEAKKILSDYKVRQNQSIDLIGISPYFITTLPQASDLAFNPIFYNPNIIDDACANNNSTVKLYREGSFNVLSLGDVECPNISSRLRDCRVLKRETDVLILAHHGADNGFTTKAFLERVRPSLAICTSDYDNQYDHPHQNIRNLLFELNIPLWTTKTGDIVIHSLAPHTTAFQANNLNAGSTGVSSTVDFVSKKSKLLVHNDDTIRNIYRPTPPYLRINR